MHPEAVDGLLEPLRKHQRHIKKWDLYAPDFPLVAMELLSQTFKTKFRKADEAQEQRMLTRIRAARPGNTICIAEYAFTSHVFGGALIERKRAGVHVYVLVDLTWRRSHTQALEVIKDLQAADIEVQHLGF
ncbi:hypothetical protein PHYBOEH_000296 [Phytophthora boehmeriae]|uniref:Uncharacterized protein n=1 Tax=Phytophthora boehmeriae TaxID=109152 RepID=A0A8T1VEK8_9STRA|nr:hypothetical protein PHYBOEH_000296 [Phytophthora boehmeriae]